MSVFDYITFEAGIEGCPFNRFQTKDLPAEWMDDYFVTPAGTLEHEAYELRDVPKKRRPYPNAKRGSMLEVFGCMERANRRREPERFTGVVNFYGTGHDGLRAISLVKGVPDKEWDKEAGAMVPAREREWFEYEAEFRDGALVGPPVRVPVAGNEKEEAVL